MSVLGDRVERQINVNKAANASIAAATEFADVLSELKKLS
jgi:hypothetical protein